MGRGGICQLGIGLLKTHLTDQVMVEKKKPDKIIYLLYFPGLDVSLDEPLWLRGLNSVRDDPSVELLSQTDNAAEVGSSTHFASSPRHLMAHLFSYT